MMTHDTQVMVPVGSAWRVSDDAIHFHASASVRDTRKEASETKIYLYAAGRDVNDATSFYIGTIGSALSACGRQLIHTDRLRDIPSRGDAFVVDCKRAMMLQTFRPHCNFWLWLQGIVPEEAELQRGSRIRKMYWTSFERRSIPRARGVFMVSQAMQRHFAEKYALYNLPVFIMPCVNQRISPRSFAVPDKYSTLRFVYAGGLQRWQCFSETLDSYLLIKRLFPHASLTVLTWDRAGAMEMIERRSALDVTVDYCRPSDLSTTLARFKYGFVLRHNHIVNTVATPTKVSSYMAAGVIPILTSAVVDFAERLSTVDPIIMLQRPDPQLVLEAVSRLESRPTDTSAILASYTRAFEDYFDLDCYVPMIRTFFRDTGMTIGWQ